MEEEYILGTRVGGARREIFECIQTFRDKKIIYFDGWDGFGAAPVLRSIAQVLPSIKIKKHPPDLCFDRIIYIDCSAWISEREMQRKIAEELELDKETMAMFDKHDEDDDFNGVDHGSRDVIRSVSEVIVKKLWSNSLIMVFLNGSDHEVDVSRFGIFPNSLNHVVVWTFKRRLLTMHDQGAQNDIAGKLRYTHMFLRAHWRVKELSYSEISALLREEAATMVARNLCMQDIDLTMATDCCLYCLFMHYCFHGTSRSYWSSQAPNCSLCDGIKGNIAREISNALLLNMNWEYNASLLDEVFKKFTKDPKCPFLTVKDNSIYRRKPYRWISISITSKSMEFWKDMQIILATASSFFMAFEKSMVQRIFPNDLFEQCSNLQVLILSCCTFSFVSPPFHKCHKLRFLGLDHCTDNKTSSVEESTKWAFLNKLWVLDMHYTHWEEIITEEKMDLMVNLQELNIEGFCCWQYIRKLQGRLCNLQRLRIIKPMQQAEILVDCNNSFIDKAKLEILDLSGNRDMKNLPASLSKASSLQVLILDGCDGLENVVLFNGLPSSLRSFSLDGYGPAALTSTIELPLESSRPECAPDTNSMDIVKISKISLQGCTKLDNLFVRGLPNLEELDLSGTPIKKLDFQSMVIDVPRLGRLFLLGCHHLRAILWGSDGYEGLELICLDTRAGRAPRSARPSLAQHKKDLHLHAILADARLSRSLEFLLQSDGEGVHFNIHITSSTEYARAIEPEAASQEMIEPNNQQHDGSLANRYNGVLTKIGDAPMLAFPEPPTQLLDGHVEFSDGSLSLETELAIPSNNILANILKRCAKSLYVHDSMISTSMPGGSWVSLKWCRVERCPNLDTIFSVVTFYYGPETMWESDRLMARSIHSKGSSMCSFAFLQHLHLRSCPRLRSVLLVFDSSFPDLETIHIINCSDLSHVFALHNKGKRAFDGARFPKLTTIHLHDLPKLQQICNVKMLAPALETIRIRGCWSLRRLPAVATREPGQRRPTVEMEKDVWDALEWDGKVVEKDKDMMVDIGHHPDLFEPPVHSRYYRRSRLLRGTVLR